MALFENFPYTNFHELNLDWIIKMVKELNDKFDDAISAKIKFADPINWDITKQYEVLTIVIDDNKAYLSMQPVPSGIPITNTEYWQNIFDMSELYQMIDDLDQRVDDFETEFDNNLQELSNTLTDDINTVNNRIDTDTVKTNLTKHLLYIGDSYSVWYSNQLYNEVVNNLGIPAAQCHNVAVSGASFQDATNSYLMQAQGYTGNKSEITDILIVGGINDALLAFNDYTFSYPDTTQVTNAMDAFAIYCANNYPNAKIHIAYVGGCLPTSDYYATVHPEKSQEWAKWCYTTYAGSLKFNILKTWNAMHTTSLNYNADGLHPSTSYGVHVIAEAIGQAFNGNPQIFNRPQLIVNISATGKNIRAVSAFEWMEDDIASLTIPDTYIQIRNGETLYQADFTDILVLSGSEMPIIRTPHYYNINVSINGFTGISSPVTVPATIRVMDGKISIKIFYSVNGAWQNLTAGSFASITIPSFPTISVPIWECN